MIQRQQTLWLLLASFAGILSFMFPFVAGKTIENGLETYKRITADKQFFILLLTIASVALSTITIFLYKNRKQQMQFCWLGIVLTAGIIIMYIVQMNKLSQATLAMAGILPFVMLISYYLAYRNIRKDERLVKSLDKLR